MVDRQIGSRRHVPIAPAINIQHQDLARYGQGSGPHTDRQSPQASRNSNGNQLNISSPPMRIPGTKPTSNVPRALPPPPHINHVSHNGTDLGWLWANQDKDMKPEPTSRPASPRSISAVERRDSESTFDEDTRRRKSSSATIASMRSPRFVDSYDTGVVGYHRDQLSSPSQSVSLPFFSTPFTQAIIQSIKS